MKRISITCFLLIACISYSFGQYKVLTTKGNFIVASGIEIRDQTVNLKTSQGSQTIDKTDILCVIPKSGKTFTFREKNNKKMKILKRDVENDYKGTDIAKIFAYKYYKSNPDIGQLYQLYPEESLTEAEFAAAFAKQQKIFKKRTIISGSILGFVIILTSAVLITTATEASQFL
jgi:hypothetical protein